MVNIHKIDLNLIAALQALLTERHVTRAAAKAGITQSAMSSALNRLRQLIKEIADSAMKF